MRKYFILMADLDSTFEEYDRNDKSKYIAEDVDQFEEFSKFIEKFEKEHNVEVCIHFVSGTSKQDYFERLKYFNENYPNLYSKMGNSVVEQGKVFNKQFVQVDFCKTDGVPYSKADAVCKVLGWYMPFEIAGACFLGDSRIDVPAFRMLKAFNRYPLGSYSISPRSIRDYYAVNMAADFYSNKPRILGCIEGLQKMNEAINEKQNNISEERSL